MPAEWIRQGEVDERPPVARIAAGGTQDYPVEDHREAKPPVNSVDADAPAPQNRVEWTPLQHDQRTSRPVDPAVPEVGPPINRVKE